MPTSPRASGPIGRSGGCSGTSAGASTACRSLRRIYRVGVAVLGGPSRSAGCCSCRCPGPGWLIVFLGLALLGTEFAWAKRLAEFTKRQLARFWAWWQARRAARRATPAA